jgi:hypothetical protein
VRWASATGELWVTEPGLDRLAIYRMPSAPSFDPVLVAKLLVDNGPESLQIAHGGQRAFTHRWQKASVALDTKARAVVGDWTNGCAASRGLAFDEASDLFIAACDEGTVSTIDASGHIVSSISQGAGFDVVGYSPALRHLYLAGGACACMIVVGVTRAGDLRYLGRFGAPSSTHCAVADDVGHAWVCDPEEGRLWRIDDPYAPTTS